MPSAVILNPGQPLKAITTTFKGPTDRLDPRIVASCEGGRKTMTWEDALDVKANHERAAMQLAEKLKWHGRWIVGSTRDGYVFVAMTEGT